MRPLACAVLAATLLAMPACDSAARRTGSGGDTGSTGSTGTTGTTGSTGSTGTTGTTGCTARCGGRACGPDGCGGSCGLCPSGLFCNDATGACAGSCTPDCSGKRCGGNGCGGTCGSCSGGQACGADGKCVCTPGGGTCSSFSDCCSQHCDQGTCAQCAGDGVSCGSAGGCCPGLSCTLGLCSQCRSLGSSCNAFSDCCSGNCDKGRCVEGACKLPGEFVQCAADAECCSPATCGLRTRRCCQPVGAGCTDGLECCNGVCKNYVCACGPVGHTCASDGECCAGTCQSGFCAGGTTGGGTTPDGQSCLSAADCAGSLCLTATAGQPGFCSRSCTSQTDCTPPLGTSGLTGECISLTTSMACIWGCTATSSCPPTTTCKSVAGTVTICSG